MNHGVTALLFMSFLISFAVPASAQTPADHVVINELDTNPPGDDLKSVSEWVELYNPTDSSVDIGGWEIASTFIMKKTMPVSPGTTIEPGQFLTFSYRSAWFTDTNEVVELRDSSGAVIDATPSLSDLQNDFTSWQRIYDGHDSDSADDWKFAAPTVGLSNGAVPEPETTDKVTVSITSDKSEYSFGETVLLSGSVSEEVFTTAPYFSYEPIVLTVSGPNYDRTESFYPDLNKNFKTTISLHKVLGINEGDYTVSASYSDAADQASFTVGLGVGAAKEPEEGGTLLLLADRPEYTPGQTVEITGSTSEVIPLEGLKFQLSDPSGSVVASGNLFPTGGKFFTSVFMTTVDPVYGTYEITGRYSDQSSTASFELVPDIKEDTLISLWTDKEVYGLGETVTITGRLNNLWIDSLDLEILQTKNIALGVGSMGGGGSVLKILDIVRLDGDSRFEYTFSIPNGADRLGDYWIKVSKDVGSATKSFVVAENPDEYVVADEPMTLLTDKPSYDLGDRMVISGKIADPVVRSSFEAVPVKLTVSSSDGQPAEGAGSPKGPAPQRAGGVPAEIEFTAIPDQSGRFSLETQTTRAIYSAGTYVVEATYQGLSKSVTVELTDTLTDKGAFAIIDKQVYGLNETVYLSGTLPPTGENTVTISLTKPDGTIINSGTSVDNQKFSWQWQTPISETPASIKDFDGRSVVDSNLGVYKIKVSNSAFSKNILFKVSANPEDDVLLPEQLVVSAEKPTYEAGEKLKVVGSVIARGQGDEGLVVPDRVHISVLTGKFPYEQIHRASVTPDQGGDFESMFELPITIFDEGQYKIEASYSKLRAESTFNVVNEFVFGGEGDVTLLVSTDKPRYHPGELVTVTGKPNKLISLEKFDISVIKKSENEITCGSFICGIHSGPVTSLVPSPLGSFTYEYRIDDSQSSVGIYEVTVDAEFEVKSITFDVTPRPPAAKPGPAVSTVIEKANRIPDSEITITTATKPSENSGTMHPRVLSGSLVTPSESDQPEVNLMVSSESGVCVIGPGPDCLVQDSTRKPGQIYDVVEVYGTVLNVRYSGPDVRLEKFDIVPKDQSEFLPDADWNVEVLKDEQVSRFYYKINYRVIR